MADQDAEDRLEALNTLDQFILLLLAASGNKPVPGALWLQKEIYLLQKIFPNLAEETDFAPYCYGPYSEILTDEMEVLKDSNLISVEGKAFALTPGGKKLAGELQTRVQKKSMEKIEEFKGLLNDLSGDELLAFVYFSHENPDELEKESLEYCRLSKIRKPLAMSLYKKDKVSVQKAAQIAGIGIEEFISEVKKMVK